MDCGCDTHMATFIHAHVNECTTRDEQAVWHKQICAPVQIDRLVHRYDDCVHRRDDDINSHHLWMDSLNGDKQLYPHRVRDGLGVVRAFPRPRPPHGNTCRRDAQQQVGNGAQQAHKSSYRSCDERLRAHSGAIDRAHSQRNDPASLYARTPSARDSSVWLWRYQQPSREKSIIFT